jgi:hypothetical protein
MSKQWHPTFVQLLRPSLGGHYEVKTNVAVGDAPRLADIVLLRRTTTGPLPFRGLWRHLPTWNALEFKGPTASPRSEDLDLLVELGLGIYRRLSEERERQGEPPLDAVDVSFWYLANHLGSRLLRGWREHAGPLDEVGPGLWRCTVLRRSVFLVSGIDLPVEQDSLPMHLIGKEPRETEREVAQFLVERAKLWEDYGAWLAALHLEAYREIKDMAKSKGRKFGIDLAPLIEELGKKEVVAAIGEDALREILGTEGVVKLLESDDNVGRLPPEVRSRLIKKLGGIVPPTGRPAE